MTASRVSVGCYCIPFWVSYDLQVRCDIIQRTLLLFDVVNSKQLIVNLNIKQMKNTNKTYEAPQAELIAIEMQGVLCASSGTSTPGLKGNGFEFGANNGQW